MKAYSLDFREKIIQVYENEAISQHQLAKGFCTVLYRNNLQTLQNDQLCWCALRNRLSQSQEPSQN